MNAATEKLSRRYLRSTSLEVEIPQVMNLFFLSLSMAAPLLPNLSWVPIHDTVMGGRSEGGVRNSDGALVFEGFLSLENNGGFASIRSRDVPDDVHQSLGLKLRFVGDGRTYLATIRLKDYNSMLYLRVPFETVKGVEQEVVLPYASFHVFAYGRQTPQVPSLLATSSPVQNVGFMLADKTQGSFSLKLLSLETYGTRPQVPALSSLQKQQVETAIQVGVPLYNKGNIEGCAQTYEDVLERIQETAKSDWIEELITFSPTNADSRAWWYRHMLNQLLFFAP